MLLVKLLAICSRSVLPSKFFGKKSDWWNRKSSEDVNPNPTEVLYGYKPESNSFRTFNHYLLIARYYVYSGRIIVLPEIKIQCEREIAITNVNLNKYRNKWTTLCISDQCWIYSNLANIFLFVLLVVVNLLNLRISLYFACLFIYLFYCFASFLFAALLL